MREQALYAGIRVAMDCGIATATVKFRLDVSFGDPPRRLQMSSHQTSDSQQQRLKKEGSAPGRQAV
jgi:hypothetical protein